MNRKHVVIIGGGLAGLSAAECLRRHYPEAFDVTVLESKQTTGGRSGSFDDPKSNSSVDYCQHVAMGCCTNLIQLLDRCDLLKYWLRSDRLTFLHPQFPASCFAPSTWLPAPLHLAAAVSSMKFLTWGQQRSIRRGLVRLMRTPTASVTNVSARTWLRQAGQDAATIRDFWDVILVSALGQTTDQAAMSSARKVLIDGFAAARGASDVWVPQRPLRDLFGIGLKSEIERLGAKVQTGCAVQEIVDHPISAHAATCCVKADHVVSAVPWHQIGRLVKRPTIVAALPNIDAWMGMPSSSITGVHLWFDVAITDLAHAVLVGTRSQWLFRAPPASGDSNREFGHYYQVVISASHRSDSPSKTDLVDHVVGELQRLFPSHSHAKLVRSVVVTDPQSVFAVDPQSEAMRPPSRTALPWLHLAGDWIATNWPATMEGSVISGRMAANSIAQSEGLPASGIDNGLPRRWLSKMMIVD